MDSERVSDAAKILVGWCDDCQQEIYLHWQELSHSERDQLNSQLAHDYSWYSNLRNLLEEVIDKVE